MNNRYTASLLCIMVLALAPACTKHQEKSQSKEDINTMIELDDSIFELEELEEDVDVKKSTAKF